MLHPVNPVRTDVLKERNASTIKVKRISEVGTTLAITRKSTLGRNVMSCYRDVEGATFLRNVCSYNCHTT
jgi:hypothetical protein